MTKLVLYAPIHSRSGYGDHARESARALVKLNRWDVKILPCAWGNTPLSVSTPDLDPITINQMTEQPDIWVMLTVPNEARAMGKHRNILWTAGMETTLISQPWVEGCNRMDLVIATSEHSKKVIEATEWTSNQGHVSKVTKPVVSLFEGLDEDIWNPDMRYNKSGTISKLLKSVKSDFNFLFVGHWLKGDHRHDRKDVGGMLEAYKKAFSDMPSFTQPGLIMKTSGAGFSVTDRTNILNRIKSVVGDMPNIHLVHGELTVEEMRDLYLHPKVKASVSFTHGEGYGRPLQEAAACGLPVIAPNWSGQADFLQGKHIPLAGKLENVHDSAVWENMILKESQWFYADVDFGAKVLKKVHKDYDRFEKKAKSLQKDILTNFTFSKMTEKLGEIMDQHAGVTVKKLKF